jgi:hypothetical protein
MIKDSDFAKLEALIARLNDTSPLTAKDEAKLDERRHAFLRAATLRMIERGETSGKATGDLAIYNQTEESFRAELRNTDNDLGEQIARFNVGLDRWFEFGETHPPYFPWRVAIILSKSGEKEKEREFLAAYCRHFSDRRGNRDEMIVARAEKRGAFSRFAH